ncbi:hypothetical protein [Bartonella sp. DGB2]|uniref:hypothetical protein n=1 Tax=Bartonella sp. DGB2 TaxID=3388426 RepID=UPI00398FDCD6
MSLNFLTFQPLLPSLWLIWMLVIAFIGGSLGLITRQHGSFVRFLACLFLGLALFNPQYVKEERAPIPSIVGIVVDESPSQQLKERPAQTKKTLIALKEAFKNYPQYRPHFIFSNEGKSLENLEKTALFGPLRRLLDTVSDQPYAGTILISDGQVHDMPTSLADWPSAPINALITGHEGEFDRAISFISPPHFGFVDQPITIQLLLKTQGVAPLLSQGRAEHSQEVYLTLNGKPFGVYYPTPNTPFSLSLSLPHAGKNILTARIAPKEGELTEKNDQAIMTIEGIRPNLRVLLVSGAPYQGIRTWRTLLKSDPNIDFIHFNILRMPENDDNAPLDDLSLVNFPVDTLFVDKIRRFDLIILDRYQHYSVFPRLYYDNIAQYVENGGALLLITGPEFAQRATSLANTLLSPALPALPTGTIVEKPFIPSLTTLGARHPLTRGLDLNGQQKPWGHWFQQIEIASHYRGINVLQGADNQPLLLLNRQGHGRVAMLLSDQSWLWARGFEGGGPYATLYRRIAHWLMKDPHLEEEALTAESDGNIITIYRQTLQDQIGPVSVTAPSGKIKKINLRQEKQGLYQAQLKASEMGLYEISQDEQKTFVPVGTLRGVEYQDMLSSTETLRPLIEQSGGTINRLAPEAPLPPITMNNATKRGIILRPANASRLLASTYQPIFPSLFVLLICFLLIGSLFWREGQ